jgi:hypothetical protein
MGLPAIARSRSPAVGIRRLASARLRGTRSTNQKGEQTMNGTVMQAILWIIAGFFLTLLIIRRSKRKAKNS